MPATAAGWIALAMVGTAGAVTYSAVSSHQATKAAQAASKKEAKQQRALQEKLFNKELQAGEYFEQLNVKQMEMQTQASSITTLANLIAETRAAANQPAQVFTLPPAKTYTPVQKLNQAIDKILKGG